MSSATQARQGLEVVQDAYAAVQQGEIERLISMMADDVEIHLPGPPEVPFAGRFNGREGAARFFLALAESAEVVEFDPIEFIADGDVVVVIGRERLTARPTNRSWATDWAMVWTVEGGEITRLREFHETAAIAGAFTPTGR